MKCGLCGKEIQTTFLGKINGNHVWVDGKLTQVCSECFAANKNDIKGRLGKKTA